MCSVVDPSKGWQSIADVLGTGVSVETNDSSALTGPEMQEWAELDAQSRNRTMDMPGERLMRLGALQQRARAAGQSL